MAQTNGSYGANSMQVLEGLDPVRKRPGMYIGSTGPTGLHHCVWEVVDNSVDEAMAGHATRIDITLLADGGCRVTDDGQGIPTDVNKQQKMTGVEIALTKLHGGGKFGGEGLQGLRRAPRRGRVGGQRAVRAASSSRSTATASATTWSSPTAARPQTKLEVVGDAPRGRTGTTVTFWPDGTVFETARVLGPHDPRAPADDGLPQQGPRDPLQGRAPRAQGRAGHLQVRRRDHRLRQAHEHVQGGRCSPRSATTS